MGGMSASPETNCAASSGRGWIAAGVIGFAVVAGVVSDKAFSQTPFPNVQVFAANAEEGGEPGNFVFNITDALPFNARILFSIDDTSNGNASYTLREGGGIASGTLVVIAPNNNTGLFRVPAGTVQVILTLTADSDANTTDETLKITVTRLDFDTDSDGSFNDGSDNPPGTTTIIPDDRPAAIATLIDDTDPPLPPRFSLSAPTRSTVSEAAVGETSMVTFTLHNLASGDGSTNNTVFLELNGRNPDSNTAFAEWGIDYSLTVTHSGGTPTPITGIPLITFFPSFELPNNVNTAEITVTPIAGDGHEAVPEIILIKATEVHLRPRQTALENNFPNCSPGGDATDPTVCTSVGARQTIAVTDAEDAPAGNEKAEFTFNTGSRYRIGTQSDTPGETGNIFLNADRTHRFVRDGQNSRNPSSANDESSGRIFRLHLSNLSGRIGQFARFRYNLIEGENIVRNTFLVGNAVDVGGSQPLPPGEWDANLEGIQNASRNNIERISDPTLTFPPFQFGFMEVNSNAPQSFTFEIYQIDFGTADIVGELVNSFTHNRGSIIPDEPYRLRVTVIHDEDQTYATAIESVQVSRSGLREGEGIVVRVTLDGRAGGVENIIPYTLTGTGIEAADIDDDNADGDGDPLTGAIAVPFYRDYGEIVITAAADGLFEGDERMTIRTTGSNSIALNAVAANNAATVALMDGDRLPVPTELVGFSIPDGSSPFAEGGSVVVTATLDHPVPQGDPAILIPYTLTGTDVTADDFSNHAVLSSVITIATGAIKGTAIITSADNALAERDKTVTVALGTLPNNSAGDQLTTSLDDITFVISNFRPVAAYNNTADITIIKGGGPAASAERILTLANAPGNNATVEFTFAGGTANGANVNNPDINFSVSDGGGESLNINNNGTGGTFMIPANTRSAALTFTANTGSMSRRISFAVDGITFADGTADTNISALPELTINITDPPNPPNATLTRKLSFILEGGSNTSFILALGNVSGGLPATVTYTLEITGDNAVAGDISALRLNAVGRHPIADGTTRTLTITAITTGNPPTITISSPVDPDTGVGDEDLTKEVITLTIISIEFTNGITLESGDIRGDGVVNGALSITLLDAAAPRVTRLSEAAIDEGNSDSLTRSSNGLSLEIHSLPDGHGDGTFSLTIPQGDSNDPSIPIPIVDRDYEYRIYFGISPTTLTMPLAPDNPTVNITVPAGVFTSGQTGRQIEVRVVFRAIDDNYDEAEQTMAIIGDVVFPNASSGSLTLTPSSSTVTISMIDNDDVSAELNKSDDAPVERVNAGNIASTFAVTITEAPDADAEVTYTLEGGVNTKYTNSVNGAPETSLNTSGTFTIPKDNITRTSTDLQGGAQGAARVIITIFPENDADTDDEDVTLTINSITFDNGSDHGNLSEGQITGNRQTLTIIDESLPLRADYDSTASITLIKGGGTAASTERTLTLANTPNRNATVEFTFAGGTANGASVSNPDINFSVSVNGGGESLNINDNGQGGTFMIPANRRSAALTFTANTGSMNSQISFTVTGIMFNDGTNESNISALPVLTINIADPPNATLTRNNSSIGEREMRAGAFNLVLGNASGGLPATVTYTLEVTGDNAATGDISVPLGPLNRALPADGTTRTFTTGDASVTITFNPNNDADLTKEVVTLTIVSIEFANGMTLGSGDILGDDVVNGALSITVFDSVAPTFMRVNSTAIAEVDSTSALTTDSFGVRLRIHSLPNGHGDGMFSLTIPQGDPNDPSIPIPIVGLDYVYQVYFGTSLMTLVTSLTPDNSTLDITIPAGEFRNGEIEVGFHFKAIDDNYDEDEQTMAVVGDVVFPNALSGSLTLTPSSSTLTINMLDDDEVSAELNKGDRAPVEGVNTPSTFTVTITQAPDADAEVTYTLEGGVGTKYNAIADGTNNAGILSANGTFTILRNNITGTNTDLQGGAQGAAEVVINITPQNDADSDNEDVTLTIHSITFANGSEHGNLSAGDIGGTGTINGAQILTIIDNTGPSATPAADYDGPAEFSITEGEEGTGTLTLTNAPGTADVAFTFSGGTAGAGTESDINFSVSGGGNPTFNADGTTGTFTIPMGTAAAVLTFTANTDSDSNSERITFTVTGITFDNDAAVSELPGPLTIRIFDRTPSNLAVSVSDPVISVGETTTVTFALSNIPARGIHTDRDGVDTNLVVARTEFVFRDFPLRDTFTIPGGTPGVDLPSGSPTPLTFVGQDYDLTISPNVESWRISDRDGGGDLTINTLPTALTDGAAAITLTVTAKATSTLTAPNRFARSFGPGNAFLRHLNVTGDLQFTITDPPTARLSATDPDAGELNNDPADATLTLMNAATAGRATVSFELSSDDAIFGVRSGDGFDPATGADYLLAAIFPDDSHVSLTGNPGTVDLPARFREVRFRITPIADALLEGPEEVEVVVTNVTFTDVPAITTRLATTITIADYGTLPTAFLDVNDAASSFGIGEGGNMGMFILDLRNAPNGPAMVTYNLLVDSDAIAAAEFGRDAAGPAAIGTSNTFMMNVANRRSTATLTITSSADDSDTTNDVVTFTVTGITFTDIGTGTDIIESLTRNFTINDDDPEILIVDFERTGDNASEYGENEDIEFRITLNRPLPEAGMVHYKILPGNSVPVIAAHDVSVPNFGDDENNSHNVPAGRSVIKFTVDIADDNRVEPDTEGGIFSLVSLTWGTHTDDSSGNLSFTITDNDGITLALDSAGYEVRDNASTLDVTVIATPNPMPSTHDEVVLDRAVVAALASADGSASAAADDYTTVSETLTYDAESSLDLRTVSIAINGDEDSVEETFTLALEKDDRAVTLVAPDAATVTIIPNISASYAPGTDTNIALTEGGASMERTLTLVNAPNAIATVEFRVTGGTVAGGSAADPSLALTVGADPTTPTINPGGTGGSFTIPLGVNNFLLTFAPFADANNLTETIRFIIDSITFADDDSMTDLEALSELVIRVTDTAAFLDSRLIDVHPEGSEVNNTPATATLTLVGPDVSGEATASFALSGSATFGTRLNDGSFNPADADYLLDIVIGGTATPATSSAGSLTLPENSVKEVHFRITPIADADEADEGDEDVAIDVSSIRLGGAALPDRTVTLTITDYDPLPTAALSLSDNRVFEGGSDGVFSLELRNAPIGTGIAEVAYSLTVGGDNPETTDITAAFGEAASGATAVVGTGENPSPNTFMMDVDNSVVSTATLIITTADDADTVNETVTFAVTGVTFDDIGTGTDIPGVPSRSLTINDDDPSTATVTISGNVNENENIEVTVTLDKPLPEDGTVRYTIRPRPAASGAGIAAHDVSGTFNANTSHNVSGGADVISFTVGVADDNRIEPDTEGGIISIASVVWGSHTLVVDADLSFTIADNDGITLTLAAAEHRVRDNAGTLPVTVNAAPNPSPSTDAGVILDRAVTATLAGSGAGGDYTVVNPSLNYAVNRTARRNIPPETITVRIRDDGDTADQTFVLTLASGDRAVSFDAPDAATVTIVPNASARYVNTAAITIIEGDALASEEQRILMIEHAPPTGATIMFTFARGAEGDSFDFSIRNGMLVINPDDRMGGHIRILAGTTEVPLVFGAVNDDGNTDTERITFTITGITFDDPGTVTDIAGNNTLRIIIRDADSSASLRLRIRTFLEGALQ